MAERGGFEPPVPLRIHVISNHAHSTTLSPLQVSSWHIVQCAVRMSEGAHKATGRERVNGIPGQWETIARNRSRRLGTTNRAGACPNDHAEGARMHRSTQALHSAPWSSPLFNTSFARGAYPVSPRCFPVAPRRVAMRTQKKSPIARALPKVSRSIDLFRPDCEGG